MCVLSDLDILRRIEGGNLLVEPLNKDLLGPDSLDLRLSETYRVLKADQISLLRPGLGVDDLTELISRDKLVLHPRTVIWALTLERLQLPADLSGLVTGRSSLARLGLQIASTIVVHPGWEGRLMLELVNLGGIPIELVEGLRICQISFFALSSVPSLLYGQKETDQFQYQGRE